MTVLDFKSSLNEREYLSLRQFLYQYLIPIGSRNEYMHNRDRHSAKSLTYVNVYLDKAVLEKAEAVINRPRVSTLRKQVLTKVIERLKDECRN